MNEVNLAIVYKKGNPELPQNYRPIALLKIAYKLLAIIILKRIVPHIDDRIDKSQYGQFSKFHVRFCGLDSGNLRFETVRTHKQHICF